MATLIIAIGIGLVIGMVLGALGGGGGVLTVPALVYLLNQTPQGAATASLVIVGVASLVGIPAHARSGNVRWGAGAAFGAAGTVAAVAGTALSRHLDASVLLLVFAAVIATAAVLMLRDARRTALAARLSGDGRPGPAPSPPRAARDTDESQARSATVMLEQRGRAQAREFTASSPPATNPGRSGVSLVLMIVAGGLVVGVMTGLFGVGGGFLAVPVLVLVMRWPLPSAIGTSLLVIVINSTAALTSRVTTDTFDWHIIVPVTAAAIVGTLVGKVVTDRVSTPVLGGGFGVMLVLLATYTAVRSTLELLD